MGKYIDAEKLKKSISNYMEGAHAALNPIDGDADYYKGKIDACKDIQDLISSLQQEQPEMDFEKEYKSYVQSRKDDLSGNAVTVNMKDLARHFYERGMLNAVSFSRLKLGSMRRT